MRWRPAQGDVLSFSLVGLLTALAAALRLVALGHQSLWLDEAQTAYEVRQSFRGMLSVVANNELTPPFYYVLMWPWTRLAGSSEFMLRLPSAVFGTASVPLAFATGRAARSSLTGLVAAAFVATSVFMIWFSQEARAYALFVFLSIASFYFFLRLLETPRGVYLFWWTATAALALVSHYFAAFLIGVQALWLLWVRRERAVVLAAAFLAAIEAALVPLAVHQAHAFPPPSVSGFKLRSHLRDLVFGFATVGYPARHVGLALVALALLAGGFTLSGERADRRAVLLALGLAAGTLLVAPALELVSGAGVYNYRHAIGAWFPLALALAVALAVRRFAWAGLVVATALCAVSLVFVERTATRPALQRDDWRGAFQVLPSPGSSPRALVTSWVFERFPVEYYDRRARPAKTVRTRELVLVSVGQAVRARVPRTFRRVALEHVQRMTIVRYRAARPTAITREELRPRGSRKRAIGLFLEPQAPS